MTVSDLMVFGLPTRSRKSVLAGFTWHIPYTELYGTSTEKEESHHRGDSSQIQGFVFKRCLLRGLLCPKGSHFTSSRSIDLVFRKKHETICRGSRGLGGWNRNDI